MYLWINIADINAMTVTGQKSPLVLLLQPNDRILSNGVHHPKKLSEIFLIIQCAKERANSIKIELEAMAQVRLERNIKIKITKGPPSGKWQPI